MTMEDFGLAREHREFRDVFRRFVTDRVAPLAERGEREHRFPREVYDVLRDGGFLAPNFPEEVGGGGGDLLTGCIYYEELTRASAGVSAGVFAHQHLAAGPILRFGSEEQRREFLAPALRGERIGAFGLTEPDAGSDIRGIKTQARRDGDDWVLNGSKLYITNGTIADFMLVAARTGATRSAEALTVFLVETSDPGVGPRELAKVGNHSSSTAFVSLEDVRVPSHRVLGALGQGLGMLKATLTEGRILVANRGLGIAQEAYELILRYAGERQAFGRSIGSFQAVAFKIADMAARIDAVRLMIYRAARLRMAGDDCIREASMAKYLASELAVRVAADALLLHGGAGYMEEMKVARLYRDAPEAWIGEGTNEIQLGVIARSLGLH
ncbi:MAG: acyl-CoA dehydrogenase family protein [Candidatus Rokubacteria bacterium]|nr:acyl-CoA dehydrogenase family protein [Candidatus Rokubacteria bacterium]